MNDLLLYGAVLGSLGVMLLGWAGNGWGQFKTEYLIDAAVGALCAPLLLLKIGIVLSAQTSAPAVLLLGVLAGITGKVVARVVVKALKAWAPKLLAFASGAQPKE